MSAFFQVAEVEAGEGVVLVDFVKTDVLEDLFSSTQFFRYVSKCGVKSPHLELYFAIF